MPALSLLRPEQWEALKIANIRGVDDPDLARQFGVTEVAIRKRRSRDPVWQAAVSDRTHYKVVKSKVAKASERAKSHALSQRDVLNVTKADSEAISASVNGSLVAIRERHPLKMATFLEKKLGQAIENDSIPAPECWRDLNTADTMLRRAVGLDKQETSVNLNFWSDPARSNPALSGELYEVSDAQEVESEVVEPE
jgi:hypothetical protein